MVLQDPGVGGAKEEENDELYAGLDLEEGAEGNKVQET